MTGAVGLDHIKIASAVPDLMEDCAPMTNAPPDFLNIDLGPLHVFAVGPLAIIAAAIASGRISSAAVCGGADSRANPKRK